MDFPPLAVIDPPAPLEHVARKAFAYEPIDNVEPIKPVRLMADIDDDSWLLVIGSIGVMALSILGVIALYLMVNA